jgi:hypothetical protein
MVDAEYGNQGVDFKMIPREGFGWMNGGFFPSKATLPESPTNTLADIGDCNPLDTI